MSSMTTNLSLTAPEMGDKIKDTIPALATNFNTIDAKLGPLSAEETALLAIAAQYEDVLSSRIVDHNLDASSPANGYYVRWDCGLQVCVFNGNKTTGSFGEAAWVFPAAFSEAPSLSKEFLRSGGYVSAGDEWVAYWDFKLSYEDNSPLTQAHYRVVIPSTESFATSLEHRAFLQAFGKWEE